MRIAAKQRQQQRRIFARLSLALFCCSSVFLLGVLSRSVRSMTPTTSTSSNQEPPIKLEAWEAPLPSRAPGTIRVVILSDTHGRHGDLPTLPHGDVLIHLGDVANRGSLDDIHSFVKFVSTLYRFPEVILIEGNHDRDLKQPDRINLEREYQPMGGQLLKDRVVSLSGNQLSVLGVSWEACETGDFSAALQASQGQKVDLLLTHCPPPNMNFRKALPKPHSTTCSYRQLAQAVRPAAHLFGHVHRQRGMLDSGAPSKDNPNNTCIQINCSSIPANRPVVLDWDPIGKRVAMVHCPCPPFY